MKRFQLKRLKYNIKSFGFFSGIKIWIFHDLKHAHERCAYCGWYLHPQLIFKGIQRPGTMVYWKEDDGNFVCSSCHFLKKSLE